MTLPNQTPEYKTASNDFRSDTFTTPTPEMIQYALTASIGDAVYNEDADTLKLEQTIAEIAGKEAGLFCVSGTLSNQIALRAHLYQPPYSILCDHRAHVYSHEAAGLAVLSQAMVIPVVPSNGNYLTLEDIVSKVVPDDEDIHTAPTRVISLENTLHGIVYPIDELRRIRQWATENGIKLHCDGARLWNASVASGVPMREYCELFDSVSICLSKSMGAPIGSVLVGDTAFVRKCNHLRKQQGGGIRQSGLIAKMALYCVERSDWRVKLGYSHELASDLAGFCHEHEIPLECPSDTNFVFVDLPRAKIDPEYLVQLGSKYDVRLMGGRISFHYQNSKEALERVKQTLLEAMAYARVHPFTSLGAAKIYRSGTPVASVQTVEH